MVFGSNLYNGGQFIYHFLTGRFLGEALYGDLASVIAILGIVGVLQMAVGLTIVKFVSEEDDESVISNFTKWVNRWSVEAAFISIVIVVLGAKMFTSFLNVSDVRVIYLTAPMLAIFLVTNSYRSVLQGQLRFVEYVGSLLSETVVKLILSILLVIAGYALFGAIIGLLMSFIASFAFTWYFLRKFLSGKRGKRPDIAPLLRFTFPVFIQGLALTSMYTTDLILVKHFFVPQEAGVYASLTVLGRVVFFGTSPVTQVMFPVITRKYAHGERYHDIFYLSLIMVVAFAVLVTISYAVFPDFVLGLLYGSSYLSGSPYLWWFGLFMGLLGVSTLLVQFYLSIGKTKIVWTFATAALLQGILIWLNHDSILTVVKMSIVAGSLLAAALLIYFPYHDKKTPVSSGAGI